MNLKEQTIEQLKVIAFDIDQAIKKNQNDYQIVINVLNEKLEYVNNVKSVPPDTKEVSNEPIQS